MAAAYSQPVRASSVRATMQPSAMPPPQASASPATVYVQQSSTVITPKVRCYCPWSFVIISIGVSSMSTGVLNLSASERLCAQLTPQSSPIGSSAVWRWASAVRVAIWPR